MGQLQYNSIQDNTTIEGADVNTPLGALYNEFNGNIDGTNIKNNSIDNNKLAANAVTADKVADASITAVKLVSKLTTITTAATITPSSQVYVVSALAEAATIAAPSFTTTDAMALMIRIKDNGTGRVIGWNTIYRAIGVTLPLTTVASKELYIGCVYNATANKWDVIAVSKEA